MKFLGVLLLVFLFGCLESVSFTFFLLFCGVFVEISSGALYDIIDLTT